MGGHHGGVSPVALPSRPARLRPLRGLVGPGFTVVGLVIAMVLLVPRPNALVRPTADVAASARAARSQLGFVPAVPVGLPPGWIPLEARVKQDSLRTPTWHVVYRAAGGAFVGYVQAVDPPLVWENTQVISGPETTSVEVDGNAWLLRNREDRGITSYVLRGTTTEIIVSGRTGATDVETLIRALHLPAGG